jgi:hypothetical protein
MVRVRLLRWSDAARHAIGRVMVLVYHYVSGSSCWFRTAEAQLRAGLSQTASLQSQLHELFYRSCCITSPSMDRDIRVKAVEKAASDRPFTHSVINFYALSDVSQPEEAVSRHKTKISDNGWDICGRIYVSYQGINAQFSGPWQDALEYTRWVASQPEFRDLTWREYPVPKHMFPKLKLKYRPNLISLQGGMQDLAVTGAGR